MKVATKNIPGVLRAGYYKLLEAQGHLGIEATPQSQLAFYSGAALALGCHDQDHETTEKVVKMAMEGF